MNAMDFIKAKQQAWAKRHGVTISDETKSYVEQFNDNLFEPLSAENRRCFESVSPNLEINGNGKNTDHIHALHSSSALLVNVFQYWQDKNINPISYACGLSGISKTVVNGQLEFKKQFGRGVAFNPNIDVAITVNNMVYAIESKFTEPYEGGKDNLPKAYLNDKAFWLNLPQLENLAKNLASGTPKYDCLDAAQLIKRIYVLYKEYSRNFQILYLWYDAPSEAACQHRMEIANFAQVLKKDGINFSHTTYQEVFAKLAKDFYTGNKVYIDYLTDRYL